MNARTLPPASAPAARHPLLAGFRASWVTVLLIAAINTGIAAVLWIDDPRPFWQPFVTVQLYGYAIAYCVNAASPWDRSHAIARIVVAVAIGAVIGVLLVIVVKGYEPDYVLAHAANFGWNLFSAWFNGLTISLMFYVNIRERRAEAALLEANAARHLLSRQAAEAELKLMQAQVEPHFLFNTLASVQYLTETDPPRANELLGHLIAYLRAALPQLRAASTTLGKELQLAAAYLNILAMRMGPRLAFTLDVDDALRAHPFPPNMLISLVENAVQHGLEPAVDGGHVTLSAARAGDALVVTVADTGRGFRDGVVPQPGHGFGLANLRERLAAMYGEAATFTLEHGAGGKGTVARLSIPWDRGA
ncbi:MAG: histidine kinase [Proteobacteria bacterium]|nr:histidine kinase [Pseudomonadota bacterium]